MTTGCGSNDQKPEKKNIPLKEIKIKKKESTAKIKNEIKETIDNENKPFVSPTRYSQRNKE